MLDNERAEEERVLYVAMTRAKEQLIVTANPTLSPSKNPFALRIAKVIGMGKPGFKWTVTEPEMPEPSSLPPV